MPTFKPSLGTFKQNSVKFKKILSTRIPLKKAFLVYILLFVPLCIGAVILLNTLNKTTTVSQFNNELIQENTQLQTEKTSLQEEIEKLKNEDQRLRNDELEEGLVQLKKVNATATQEYERLLNLESRGYDVDTLALTWAEILQALSESNYNEAKTTLQSLQANIQKAEQELSARDAQPTPVAAVQSNEAPSSGYTRQQVSTDAGNFTVSLIAADLGSTRVIVDTASENDCGNECPVLTLGDYVSRNGGYAGINGSYFCPASYPSCAGKTNSFDLLAMNKNKTYFNSDNNVYSSNPAVIFFDGSIRFVGAASGWGRDTSPTGVLSNYPLLVSGNNIQYSSGGEGSFAVKSNRSFVANKGNTVYIGVVHSATVAESAIALRALGMENALNLDSGGSTALWSGGYKVGPGRNIPNAIVFVRK